MDSPIERHVTDAAGKVQPGAAIDFAIIIQIITALMGIIQNCPFGNAKRVMRAGSTEAKVAVYNAVRNSGFGGNAVDLTNELVERGKNATDAELDETIESAMSMPGLSKFCAFLLAIVLCGSAALAGPFPSVADGPFPLTMRGGDLASVAVTPGSGDERPASLPAPESSSTAVCTCQGHKRRECHCLKNNVPCKCNTSKGSVWNLDENGRATSKTGAYADPRKNVSVAVAVVPQDTGDNYAAGHAVTKRSDGRWWWHDGVTWWNTWDAPHDGLVYNGTWEYQGGKVRRLGSQMAVQIQPAGHYEMRRQCVGGVCRMYRVWITE